MLQSGQSAGQHDLEKGGLSLCKAFVLSMQAKSTASALKYAVRTRSSQGEPSGLLAGMKRYYTIHLDCLTGIAVVRAFAQGSAAGDSHRHAKIT